ncbi:MAG: hypothetical protein ACOH1Y_17195 [Propionicimonas sp.]
MTDETCTPRVGDGATVCVEELRDVPAPTGPEATTAGAVAATITSRAIPGTNTIAAPVPCVGTGTDGKRVVALYATAPGFADRYKAVAPKIRQWAGQASQELWFASAGQTYGQKLRWATTTPRKGACAVTVAKVIIPAANYTTATTVWDYLAKHGFRNPNAHYVVWVENPPTRSGACGLGQMPSDTRPSADVNTANTGTMFAWLTPPCWESGALHEVLHTLGAASSSSPHATKNGHCTDGADLMCYSDGPGVVIAKTCLVPLYVRQPLRGGIDCGRDTYYSQAPAAGSYLDTHWNVASSPFLARTAPAPALPVVSSASGPRSALPGTVFTLKSGSRRAPAGARPGSALWLTPAGCKVNNPVAATTTAYCDWLVNGVKTFTAVSTDKYGRLGARAVKVTVPAPVNRQLAGVMTPARKTAKPGTRMYVTLTIKDAATSRRLAKIPVVLRVYRSSTGTRTAQVTGVTNTAGQVRLSYIQPSGSVNLSSATFYSPGRWKPWVSPWVAVARA